MLMDIGLYKEVKFYPYRIKGVVPIVEIEYGPEDTCVLEFEERLYRAAGRYIRYNHVCFELTDLSGNVIYVGISDWHINIGISTYPMY